MERRAAPDFMDLEHSGPDTLPGRYLRRFWQPVYRSEDLAPGRATPIRIMNEDFTLYRGESGTPHLVGFRCAHRGTQLSVGWVEDDCIRCRYHGWKYEGSGQCVEQPGETEGYAERIQIGSYPVREYLGLVFAYLGKCDGGESAPPPFRLYPDFEQPGVIFTIRPEIWPCNFFNRMDNDADGFHVLFTHRESIQRAGRTEQYARREVSCVETEYGVRTMLIVPGGRREYLHSIMPNVNQIRVKTGVNTQSGAFESIWEDRMTWAVPIDDANSLRFEVNLVHLTDPADQERLRAQRSTPDAQQTSVIELAEAVLAGRLTIEELDPSLTAYQMFRIEDYVTEVGQGRLRKREIERLASIDVGVSLRRKLWEDELAALQAGRPLRDWVVSAGLVDMAPLPIPTSSGA